MGLTDLIHRALQLFEIHGDGVHRLNRYSISDSDTSSTTTKYYGFLNSKGGWYVMKINESPTGVFSYRYYAGEKGLDNYISSWSNRVGLPYNTFNDSGL